MFELNQLLGGTEDYQKFREDLDKGNWKEFKINPRDFMSGIGSLFKEAEKLNA